MLCMTGVYLRDVTDTIFVILHLNASNLSFSVLVIQYHKFGQSRMTVILTQTRNKIK